MTFRPLCDLDFFQNSKIGFYSELFYIFTVSCIHNDCSFRSKNSFGKWKELLINLTNLRFCLLASRIRHLRKDFIKRIVMGKCKTILIDIMNDLVCKICVIDRFLNGFWRMIDTIRSIDARSASYQLHRKDQESAHPGSCNLWQVPQVKQH